MAFQPGRRPLSPLTLSTCPSPFLGVGGRSATAADVQSTLAKSQQHRKGKQRVLSFICRAREKAFPPRERGRARIRTRCPLLGLPLRVPAPCHVRSLKLSRRGNHTSSAATLGDAAHVHSACCVFWGRRSLHSRVPGSNPGRAVGLCTGCF